MDEATIRETFDRLRKAHAAGDDPDPLDLFKLAEGALINLATIAAHASRKSKG